MSARLEAIHRYKVRRDDFAEMALETLAHLAFHIAHCERCINESNCQRADSLYFEIEFLTGREAHYAHLVAVI